MSVVVPGTTELLDLSSLPTDELAHRLDFFAELNKEVGNFRRAVSDELAQRLDHEGRRSADVGEWHIEISAPTEKAWDIDRLIDVIDRFVSEDKISQRKATACFRFKQEVVWSEVKTLLSDPRVAPEISLCFEEQPTTRYARVRKA